MNRAIYLFCVALIWFFFIAPIIMMLTGCATAQPEIIPIDSTPYCAKCFETGVA